MSQVKHRHRRALRRRAGGGWGLTGWGGVGRVAARVLKRCEGIGRLGSMVEYGPHFFQGANAEDVEAVLGELPPLGHPSFTYLHLAAVDTRDPEVIVLLANRFGLPSEDGLSPTPLHSAVLNPCIEIAQRLISLGADVNAEDDTGSTPLHIAVQTAHDPPPIVRLLLDNDADIEAQDSYQQRPLHIAAMRADLPASALLTTISLLVERQAEISAVTSHGKTACDIAKSNNASNEVITLLCR